MFRRLLVAAALVGVPMLVTSAAHAQFKDGDFELTLSGMSFLRALTAEERSFGSGSDSEPSTLDGQASGLL